MKDAKGLSDAHHRVASKDLCGDSQSCPRAAQMDPAPQTGEVETGLEQPPLRSSRSCRSPRGHAGWKMRGVTRQGDMTCSVLCKQQDQICSAGFELCVTESTIAAILS